MASASDSLDIQRLRQDYCAGRRRPSAVIETVLARIAAAGDDAVWISRFPDDALRSQAVGLDRAWADDPTVLDRLPLFGVPFAVKDNIDVAGLPTTAACPAFAYTPGKSATVVDRLTAAGAIVVGKTNLDQFATGLVGVRSPYGVARNPFDAAYLPGGSSSGSAVAVSSGLVSFALGTDTAGSGRVPAGFNNIVGLKPSIGLLSTSGVVPACRALDVVSIFALGVGDSLAVLRAAMGFDAADIYSRAAPAGFVADLTAPPARFRCAVPRPDQRAFFGDAQAASIYARSLDRLRHLGATLVEVDYAPLAEAAAVLYSPAGAAERTTAIDAFIAERGADMHPVTRAIIDSGRTATAVDVYRARDRLRALRRHAEAIFADCDVLAVPTSGTIYRVEEVLADPVRLNSNLGHYTNFVNQLDLSAIAVPAGLRADGLPAGLTLIAPAFREGRLAALGEAFHRDVGGTMGATGVALPPAEVAGAAPDYPDMPIVVVGAHMRDLPLNRELKALGARFESACATAPTYRFYRLPGAGVARPGLVRVATEGVAIDGEIWRLPTEAVGALLARVPSPLGLGDITLADGRKVKGFLCEAAAVEGAEDISSCGGWRGYLARAAAT
ncbi:MAG: allophanate hydrolase [Alphaproteobacteria bacterium]|nr:allophanate hydrolase [Alphaproteobacteria bacterium]MCW5740328.1 allophanate hydrolase [Alphaproteobacteria bacterium]